MTASPRLDRAPIAPLEASLVPRRFKERLKETQTREVLCRDWANGLQQTPGIEGVGMRAPQWSPSMAIDMGSEQGPVNAGREVALPRS
jgi:hypothetical protein